MITSDETGHKQSLIKLCGADALVDCAIQLLVAWMNSVGLYTTHSCQGDPEDYKDKNAYVMFHGEDRSLRELLLVLEAFKRDLDDEPYYISIDLSPSNSVRYTLRFVSRPDDLMTGYDFMQMFQTYLLETGEI
jgi:hypothetical protein